jgi:glucose-1-phosphate thymidylyltransferase
VKALVLCAGRGSRLAPLTLTRPKAAVPVAGRPVLQQILRYLIDQGFREIGIVVAPGQEGYLNPGPLPSGVGARLITQPRPLGIADAVRAGRSFLGEEPFLLYLGDNLTTADLRPARRRFERDGDTVLLLLRPVTDPSAFGVAELEGDRVVAVWEKADNPPSNLAIAGIYFFQPAIHQAIDGLLPSARGEYEITDAIASLIRAGAPVRGLLLDGLWQDMGSPGGLLAANRLLLGALQPLVDPTAHLRDVQMAGPIWIGPGAIVERSRLTGPVRIEAGAVVRDAHLGPDLALGKAAVVEGATVADSILLPGARVTGPLPPLRGALLGERSVVMGVRGQRSTLVALSPVLGDAESLTLLMP